MPELNIITLNNVDYEIVDPTSRKNSSSALTTAENALNKAEQALNTPSISYNQTKKAIIINTNTEVKHE